MPYASRKLPTLQEAKQTLCGKQLADPSTNPMTGLDAYIVDIYPAENVFAIWTLLSNGYTINLDKAYVRAVGPDFHDE